MANNSSSDGLIAWHAPLMRLAVEMNSFIVQKFVIEAGVVQGKATDARILAEASLEPLASLVALAAGGTLARSQWKIAIAQALDEAVPQQPPPPAARTIGELMKELTARIPRDAHLQRLSLALDEVEAVDASHASAAARTVALERLLHGTTLLPATADTGGGGTASSDGNTASSSGNAAAQQLRKRILTSLAALAQPPLGLVGLVQAPLLSTIEHSPITSDGGAERADPADSAAAASAPAATATAVKAAAATATDSIAAATPAASIAASTAAASTAAASTAAASTAASDESTRFFLAAAELARRGTTARHGSVHSRHGCILVEDVPVEDVDGTDVADDTSSTAHATSARDTPSHAAVGEDTGVGKASAAGAARSSGRILGEGWNHDVYEQRDGRSNRRRVMHAECHAIADAIRRRGEEGAFAAFRRSTCWIVELRDESGYDDAPPCPKCDTLLRACGVPRAVHSTNAGVLGTIEFPAPRPDLLKVEMACKPLQYACDELGVRCERLERALSTAAEASKERCGGSGGKEREPKRKKHRARGGGADEPEDPQPS